MLNSSVVMHMQWCHNRYYNLYLQLYAMSHMGSISMSLLLLELTLNSAMYNVASDLTPMRCEPPHTHEDLFTFSSTI